MSRWRLVDFEHAPFKIIDGDRGKNYPKQNELLESGYCLFLNASNVTKHGFEFQTCQFITEQKDSLLRKGKLIRGDIVLTTRGTIGNVAYFTSSISYENLRINSGMIILRCDQNNLFPGYLYYYLRSPQFHGQVHSLRSGVAQPQLPIRDMKRIKMPLPELTIQARISEVLSAYDDLIENNRRRIQLLEESARLLYREWFVHLRFPGHEHVKIIDGIPEGWDSGTVSSFFKTTSGGTPSRKKPEFFTGNIPWVKTQELQNSFIFDTEEKITDDAVRSSSAKLFAEDTVLVAMYGATIGQTGILAMPSTTNQACCALIPDHEKAHHLYAFLFLRENKQQLINLSQGAAQNNINQEIIRNFPMTMPSKLLISQFLDCISPAFNQIKNLQQQNQKLQQARDLLLPRLMNGEITL